MSRRRAADIDCGAWLFDKDSEVIVLKSSRGEDVRSEIKRRLNRFGLPAFMASRSQQIVIARLCLVPTGLENEEAVLTPALAQDIDENGCIRHGLLQSAIHKGDFCFAMKISVCCLSGICGMSGATQTDFHRMFLQDLLRTVLAHGKFRSTDESGK